MIFLDYASATPVCEKAKAAMAPYESERFFNPSAPYLPAKYVREDYEKAKSDLAHLIGAKGDDLIITAGATEANNLAFSALATNQTAAPIALILATEHASILNTSKKYNTELVKVDKTGRIDLKDFQSKLNANVGFVSVALANNELGTIQPLAEIAELIKKERMHRLAEGNSLPLIFHSDASQALNLVPISVSRLGTDLLTINSAKIYGPKGVGALYQSHRAKLAPITEGGGQEKGLRSGTENVPGLIGFAAAANEINQNTKRKHYEYLRQILKTELKKSPIEPLFLGNEKHQLANFCPVSFPGLDAERLIYLLEEDEIYLSTGAACAASKGEPSHVLRAIGLNDAEIRGSLRISLGAQNTEEDMRFAGQKIVKAIETELARL